MMHISPAGGLPRVASPRRGRGLAVRLGTALTCLALLTDAPVHSDDTEPAAAVPTGLKGLLAEDAPPDILATLGTLPESWTTWKEGVDQALIKFYSETADDLAGQQAALTVLKVKLATVKTALDDNQYGAIRTQLISLRGGLTRRIDVLEAVLDTLSANPLSALAPALEKAKQDLLAATDVIDGYLDSVQGGADWKHYLRTKEIRAAAMGGTDPAAFLAQVGPVLNKLQDASKSDDPAIKNFSAAPALRTYRRDLDRAVGVLTRATGGSNNDEVRNQLKALLTGLEKYEAGSTTEAAVQVRLAYDALRRSTVDNGERLTAAMRQHYFNSNIQFAISEGFLNRVLAKTQTEEGGVRDFVLGADVYGSQVTTTSSTFDILPSENGAFIRINLTGTVSTNTEAYKSSVIIYSNGNNQFFGAKDIHFDGVTFSTQPASIQVSASSQPVGASTKLDRVPLLGKFARHLALDGAERNRPAAESIAAERVSSRVGPEFDNAVDSNFSELNGKLNEKVVAPLKSDNLYPDYKATRSTDSELELYSRLMANHELAGDIVPNEPVASGELALRVHESLINNVLDRLELAGKTMSEEEIRQLLEGKLSKLSKKDVTIAEPKPVPAPDADLHPQAFIFADKDPLRIKISDGKLTMIIRAGFLRDPAKGGNIPPQIITIPLTISVQGDDIILTRGEVTVDPVDPPAKITEQIARAGVIKSKLQTGFLESRQPRKITLNKDDAQPITIHVIEILGRDGWASIRFQ